MKISEKLYNLRTAHGLSMVEFGRIAGASDVSINFWERGLRSPKVKYIRNICDRYGIDLATFLDESNDIYDGTRPENIIPIPSMRRVPLIGTIACGQPSSLNRHCALLSLLGMYCARVTVMKSGP